MHPDLAGRVDALFYYGALEDASDEHGHGTHVAGIVAGDGATGEVDDYNTLWGLGVAPGSHIIAQRLFDGEGGYEAPPSFLAMTSDAIGAGADIGSNSWGDDTQGRYDLSAAEFDALVRDGDGQGTPYILEFSAGNAGPGSQTIGSPAVAKNVIATGASQNERFDYFIYEDGRDAMADFSSRGPAEDGRIKPDLVAPGTWISSLRSPVGNDEFAWADISFYYMFQGGTSQAGPHASGAAAIFVEYYRQTHTNATPSPALVKAALINSAADMDDSVETEPVPNNDEGWGRIDLEQLIGSDRDYDYVDQSVTLTTGQQFERYLVITDEEVPLFVTLAYTDVPAYPGAVPALVNNLDLEVVAPDGRIYRGNQFLGGESIPDSAAADNLNNVECVFIGAPLAGQYIFRVRGRNVPQGAQDFALAVSARLPAPGTSFVFFDRRAYTAPGRINVKVVDPDLAGQSSVNVTVRSTSQSGGVLLSLNPSGIQGTFTGSVATVTATGAGALRIAHGDTIDTSYFDASAGVTRTAIATADLLPPSIFNVGTSNSFGKTVVYWETDQPTASIVRYGTNTVLNFAVTNGFLTDSHSVSLSDLIPGRTYYFLMISEDEAGNRATNNNGGALFTFVAAQAATVLLVENYQSDGSGFGPDIPLSVYTNTLQQIGVSYEVWNMVDLNDPKPSPAASDLRPFSIVIWRVSDNVFINNTLSASEQTAIREYVQSGGSFFMSSMEQLSRLSPAFKSEVLQVVDFGEDETAPSANGIVGNIVTGGGISLPLDYSNYETEWYQLAQVPPDISDTIVISTNAFPILVEDLGEIVGFAYPRPELDRTGRVVFLSYPLDAVSESASPPNNRATLMQRILAFLAPGQQGVGSITLNNTEFTVPSLAIIEVGDSDLTGAGQVTVNVASTSEPSGVTMTLHEFGRFGIFRGNLPIVPTHGTDPLRELIAADGDTLIASYFDASRGSSITFTAKVETVAPVVTGTPTAEPGYVDAWIWWDTDEASDSLVQFGESPLLGRTGYGSTLDTFHEVGLVGLQPDRVYYYQVVSRDNAGNTVIDDNDGSLYTFRTLVPYSPPWSDSLDFTNESWSVFPAEESESDWQLGVPQNGVPAHSGVNVWGSNLDGNNIGYAESFLISPPIYLTEGSTAKLRFWQNFNFYESEDILIHLGEVAIITNTAVAPITLGVFEDEASDDWQEVEFDLTPYSGNLVYIVWHYAYFSIENSPEMGWLIDDISITGSSILRITNNLAQASFTVTGPTNFTGQGFSFTLPVAPPGQYSIVYNAVPYYSTPASQTASLPLEGNLTFHGNYFFNDVNNNGMSDSWEQAYFGNVSPSRTASTDTDGDGMTDLAEFIAGTNPSNALSIFRATGSTDPGGMLRFTWPATGRIYRVYGGVSLVNPSSWQPVTDWQSANFYTVPPGADFKFFRVEVKP